jgi:hypothetical protein
MMAKKVGNSLKMPSALSHGAFSTIAFLRGEDPNQFKKLVLDLTEEWAPLGAMEEETVLALAGLIWSRRRIQRSIAAQILMSRMDPSHPTYDKALHEATTCQSELSILEDNPQYAAKCLETYAVEVRLDFLTKYPRTNYPSEAEWALAICEELKMKIRQQLEHVGAMLSEFENGIYPTALTESANVVRDDLYEKEQNQLERIDNRIDRLLKRLYTLKGMKPALVSPLLNNHVPQQKMLPTDKSATAQH